MRVGTGIVLQYFKDLCYVGTRSAVVIRLFLQDDVEREGVVVLAACRTELCVDGDCGHVCASGECVVQHARNAFVDIVVCERSLYDFACTRFVCAVAVLP